MFLRAVPEARISLVDDQLTVAMPSGLAAGVVKVRPLVQVAKLLHEEATLYEWTVVFLAMAGRPGTSADARGWLVAGSESDHESPTRHSGHSKAPTDRRIPPRPASRSSSE